MDLIDGLKEYQKNSGDWEFTKNIEEFAQNTLAILSKYGDNPSKEALSDIKKFLEDVERWKAMCIQDQMGMASKNSESSIWKSLQVSVAAIKARKDKEALLAVMSLKGFGSSIDDETGLRRAKRATAILRFIDPDNWGVVDWRVVVILGLFEKYNGDINRVLTHAKKEDPKKLRINYDIIDEDAACEINRDYRAMRSEQLQRVADVEMALFGLSLIAWPIKA